MAYYKELLKKWQQIQKAMSKIDNANKSLYFNNFSEEVEERVTEYKYLSEKEKNSFNNVQFPFEAELNDFDYEN